MNPDKMTKNKSTMKKWFLITLVSFFCSASLFAQTKTVKGVIKDTSGEAIIGASVVVKGTTVGTVTDIDGNYSINVPAGGKTLSISYVGMKPKESPITGSVINVTLEENATDLDEVVVIGYGTVKRKDLTGSVSSVGERTLKDIPVSGAAEAITGKLAGVQVTTTEGSPDADIKIRVRGGGSITGDNTPLYIVDGFPVNSINDISPSDIQSIDVLKDASSTAIYGARGANGVIIVTTKTPKEGKFSISYNGYGGFKKIAKTLDVLNPYEYANWQYEQAVLQNKVTDQYVSYFGNYRDMDIYKSINGSDWQDEVFGRTGSTFNNNISITGGSEKVSYNFSYNRIDDKAIMMESDYYRNNLNLKLNIDPLKGLKLSLNGRYSETGVNGAGANETKNGKETSSDTRLKQCVIYTPISMRNIASDSDDEEVVGNLYPPTQVVKDNYKYKYDKRYNFNGSISYEFIKGLVAKVEFGVDDQYTGEDRYYGASTDYLKNKAVLKTGAAIMVTNSEYRTTRNTNTISYDKKNIFGKDHNLSLMIGEETISLSKTTQTKTTENMPWMFTPQETFKYTAAGVTTSFDNFISPEDNLLSFFGRINYDYAGKYLATATFREDGSSRFAPGSNQWGFFPSLALAWRISDEEFLKSSNDWLSNLKLRLSYGTAGNNNIDRNYEPYYKISTTNYLNVGTSYWNLGSKLYNPDLRWETTYTRNAGIDYGFFNGRISGSVDLYYNTTKDLLIDFPTSGTGYGTQPRNMGETSNKGIEFAINTAIIDKKNYGLDFNFNIGFNKNKVENLGGLQEISAASGWNALITTDYKVMVGNSVGRMYGYVTDGFYTVDDFDYVNGKWVAKTGVVDNSGNTGVAWGPGALKLKDIKADGVIDANDMTIIGDANPKASGGFSLNGHYKGFDLAANFTFVYGNDIYNANKIEFTSNNNANYKYRNMTTDMGSTVRWTNIDNSGALVTDPAILATLNSNASIWSPNYKYLFHSWAVEDGSFLRLNSLTIGYSLPKSLISKVPLQLVRFYATGSNLFVWTKYSGYDPEVDSRRSTPLTPGVDYSAYPKSIGCNFGVNITF